MGTNLTYVGLLRERQLLIRFLVSLSVALAVWLLPGTAGIVAQKKSAGRRPATRQKTIPRKVNTTQERRETLLPIPSTAPDPEVESADVSITAHVRARSLKFDAVPNASVKFFGQPERDTVWTAERENLPTPVQPGVTYRDIGIRLKITSVFRDIDRIVAEALGEIPISDDASGSALSAAKTSAPKQAASPGHAAVRPASREHP